MREKSCWLRLALSSDENDISVACGARHGLANDVELNKYFLISTEASHCVDRMDIPASFNRVGHACLHLSSAAGGGVTRTSSPNACVPITVITFIDAHCLQHARICLCSLVTSHTEALLLFLSVFTSLSVADLSKK